MHAQAFSNPEGLPSAFVLDTGTHDRPTQISSDLINVTPNDCCLHAVSYGSGQMISELVCCVILY